MATRTIPAFVLLMSLFGTHMTAFSLLGASGESYRTGIGVFSLMASSSALVVPTIFKDYTGFVDANGRAVASIVIPPESGLVGQSLYTAFALLDTSAPSGAASIGNRLPVTFEP